MKRALFVGVPGSDSLFFLRMMKSSDNSSFISRKSKDFKNVTFFAADVIEREGDEMVMKLDVNGEELKYMSNNVYKTNIWPPEIPQEMTFKTKKNEKNNKKNKGGDHQG